MISSYWQKNIYGLQVSQKYCVWFEHKNDGGHHLLCSRFIAFLLSSGTSSLHRYGSHSSPALQGEYNRVPWFCMATARLFSKWNETFLRYFDPDFFVEIENKQFSGWHNQYFSARNITLHGKVYEILCRELAVCQINPMHVYLDFDISFTVLRG